MRRFRVLFCLIVALLPAWAAKRVTVEQLEQTLRAATATHRTDVDIAKQIGVLRPSERISEAALNRLNKQFASGPQTALALQLLADTSAFLDLPASEVLNLPSPDEATREKQFDAVRKFALEMLPRLPNLLATRTTYNFDDSAQEIQKGAWLEQAGLHLVGTVKTEVSVRERENLPASGARASSEPSNGFVTWGEFGSALLLILGDSNQGKTAWSHWEQGVSGPLSVFDYAVPKSASHYEIATPVEPIVSPWSWYRGAAGMVPPETLTSKVLRTRPAYHGSLWVDPAGGAIVRISLIADLKGDPALESGAILIEYGPVRVNGKTFICPSRSLAFSAAPANVKATLEGTATEWLNENLFSDYHVFASTSRILTENAEASVPEIPPQAGAANGVTAAYPQPRSTAAPGTEPSRSPEGSSVARPSPESALDKHPAEPVARGEGPQVGSPVPGQLAAPKLPANLPAAEQQTQSGQGSTGSAQPPPPVIGPAQPAREAGATLKLNVNALLVPVVVRDADGHTVDDLQKQNFQAFDDGKPRRLSGFSVEKRGLAILRNSSVSVVPQETAMPGRVTVFIFDDLHLNADDIASVRTAAPKALEGALTGQDTAAVVTTSGKVNSGLTRDRAKLSEAIMAVRPHELYPPASTECPKIGYYQADLIVNKHSEDALQNAIRQTMSVCDPNQSVALARGMAEASARRVLSFGLQDTLTTYAVIGEYVHTMAKLPGQHTIILVSSGFLPVEEQARTAESKVMSLAAESNVTINALDARGLYAPSPTATERELSQVSDYREQEMKVAENAMGELANATGGDFFHNSNDLEAGFQKLLDAPETVYVLELPLDGVKPDGAYHHLRVKVDRTGVRVLTRRGYVARAERTNAD